jgi:hypothetical protein
MQTPEENKILTFKLDPDSLADMVVSIFTSFPRFSDDRPALDLQPLK